MLAFYLFRTWPFTNMTTRKCPISGRSLWRLFSCSDLTRAHSLVCTYYHCSWILVPQCLYCQTWTLHSFFFWSFWWQMLGETPHCWNNTSAAKRWGWCALLCSKPLSGSLAHLCGGGGPHQEHERGLCAISHAPRRLCHKHCLSFLLVSFSLSLTLSLALFLASRQAKVPPPQRLPPIPRSLGLRRNHVHFSAA